jgi:3-dehydroquinate synthase/shikimate kinase/3-dehydroquinate synthase
MNFKKKFNNREITKIISFMKKDKKNLSEKINLILIKKIGKISKPNNFTIDSNELKKFLISQNI